MYAEDDMLPISALQHWVFCPRQCALIHLEQAWAENRLTAQGRLLHDRAHAAGPESRGDLRAVRGLRVCSRELALTGQADVVEFCRPGPDTPSDQRATVPGLDGAWTVRPVEYKRGRSKRNDCDRVQLCAQAMCLEEMLHVRIPEGGLFYGRPRRREAVVFDAALRRRTQQAAREVHELIRSGVTPPPEYSRKCRSCSLIDSCLPKRSGGTRGARAYLRRRLGQALGPDSPGKPGREDP